jgi:methionyl-tRNA formyltransferase
MSNSLVRRALLCGDVDGLPMLLKAVPRECACALVGAEIRPRQHEALRRLAETHRLPLLIQPRTGSTARYREWVEAVRALGADLILANSYAMVLPPEILALPKYGSVNIHGALLPQYRGCNPIQWALLNDETATGATMHYMTPDPDAGDIIAQRRVPIRFEDTWRDVQARIACVIEAMLEGELPKVLNGTAIGQPQDESRAHRYPRRHPSDGRIDWRGSARHVYNLIRALVRPHPGAFFGDGENRVVLDEYRTIAQVIALKYGPAGGQRLVSGLVAVAPPTSADLAVLLGWLDDARRPACDGPVSVPASESDASLLAIQQRNDRLVFAVRIQGSNALIGAAQLRSIDYGDHQAEVALRWNARPEIMPGAADALRLLLAVAFTDLNLCRVYARVPSSEAALVPFYEQVGFIRGEACPGMGQGASTLADGTLLRMRSSEYARR